MFVHRPRLRVAELLIAIRHADQGLRGKYTVAALRHLLVLLDRGAQIAVHQLGVHRGLEQPPRVLRLLGSGGDNGGGEDCRQDADRETCHGCDLRSTPPRLRAA